MNTLNMIIILLLLNASNIPGRRHYDTDESFENLLIYKDCKYKEKQPETTTAPPVQKLRANLRARPNQCMSCCNMCCNLQSNLRNQFGDYDEMGQPQQMEAPQFLPQRAPFLQPDPVPNKMDIITPPNAPVQMKKKKKSGRIAPINAGGRRDMGRTREHIKLLLSRDEEMKRILRDLVRVTIQKVGLLEKMQHKRAADDVQDVQDDEDSDESD